MLAILFLGDQVSAKCQYIKLKVTYRMHFEGQITYTTEKKNHLALTLYCTNFSLRSFLGPYLI